MQDPNLVSCPWYKQLNWRRSLPMRTLSLVVVVAILGIALWAGVARIAAKTLQTGTVLPRVALQNVAATPFNNEGISNDTNTNVANLDLGGRSLSNNALAAANFTSGSTIAINGLTFQWPTVAAGSYDNWMANGQVLNVTAVNTLGFLGTGTNGTASGTATITYTDGSTQNFTLGFNDWTLGGGGNQVLAGTSIAATTPYRNLANNVKEQVKTYVFFTSVALAAGKTTLSVTLPATVAGGQLHIFALGTAAQTVSTAYNNEGISSDNNTNVANLDLGGRSLSNNALTAIGYGSGAKVISNGYSFQWPTVGPGIADNWMANGQVLAFQATGALGILGTATNGTATGTVTLTYTDGSTGTFTLGFSDWTLGGGGGQVLAGTSIAAATPYRNLANNTQDPVKTYVFFTSVVLTAGKTLQSVTLPTVVTGGQLHVFALGTATAVSSVPFNNEGISVDGSTAGNFDGGGASFSNNALTQDGFSAGGMAQIGGFAFHWPTVGTGINDNWQANGQIIPVTATNQLAFIGSSADGNATGTATITYTDGSTQTVTLNFADWTLGGGGSKPLDGTTIAAPSAYRNHNNGTQENVYTYLFMQVVGLNGGKTTQSITLPNNVTGGVLHVFAISGQASSIPNSDWSTYLGNDAHTGYNANEQIINATSASTLHLKWAVTNPANNGMSDQRTVVGGLIYWGSWDGIFHATNLLGHDVWTANVGTATNPACAPPTVGVVSSPVVATINGRSMVFVGGGNDVLYAFDAVTGQTIWSTPLNQSPLFFNWSSPMIYNGYLYIGNSSMGDCPQSPGSLNKVNPATGQIVASLQTVPPGCLGGGLWGSPVVDDATGMMYIATGNNNDCGPNNPEPYAEAIDEVNPNTMTFVSYWTVPLAQQQGDSDFGNTPTLFDTTINGTLRHMIGVANKNGIYYALDRTNIAAGPVWEDVIAYGGDCQDCADGSVSPSAFDGTTLYIGGGRQTATGTQLGSVRAVNPSNGQTLWVDYYTDGPVIGAVLAANGVVAFTHGPSVEVVNAKTGASYLSYHDTGANASFFAPVTFANGVLYTGSMSGTIFAFTP